MNVFVGILLGSIVACMMIFSVKAMPIETQGSVGTAIGLVVGLALGFLASRTIFVKVSNPSGEGEGQ